MKHTPKKLDTTLGVCFTFLLAEREQKTLFNIDPMSFGVF